jgi:magnesium-protoporphyrin O-methyltransferase
MAAKKLLIVTALVETATGLMLLVSPALVVAFLLGASVDAPPALVVARMAGAALLSLGCACWLGRNDGPNRAVSGLVAAMLLYNSVAVAVLVRLGILSLELLDAGFSAAVVVDSSAYLAAASEEAARRGRSESTQFVHGDFVDVAGDLAPADAVTLDRVVCCYPSYDRLLEQALRLAEHAFAFSYPRDRWFVRLGIWLENTLRRRRGNPFRAFVHPPAEMTRIIERAGFTVVSSRRTLSWSCDVFVSRA